MKTFDKLTREEQLKYGNNNNYVFNTERTAPTFSKEEQRIVVRCVEHDIVDDKIADDIDHAVAMAKHLSRVFDKPFEIVKEGEIDFIRFMLDADYRDFIVNQEHDEIVALLTK